MKIKMYKERIFVVLGFISLVLGIIGTLMPVMPTVPFLFVAYFCFKKGSKRFKKWYENSYYHKRYVQSVEWFLAMPFPRKLLYLLGMCLFFACLFYLWYYLYVHYFEIVLEYIKSLIG